MKDAKVKPINTSQSSLIYADKVMGVGLGAGVSKVVLGMETPGGGEDIQNATLVLPTHALLELVELVNKTLENNDSLRDALISQWNELSQKLEGSNREVFALESPSTKTKK